MASIQDYGPGGYSLVLFLFGILLFCSGFTEWWAALKPPWYVPYLLWLMLTAATALLARRLSRHDV